MSRTTPALAPNPLEELKPIRSETATGIESEIAKNSTERVLRKTTQAVIRTVEDAFVQALRDELAPHLRFQYEHVRESDFRIWGRKDNIAISKLTAIELFSAMARALENDLPCPGYLERSSPLRKALFIAGYNSGRLFIDDLCDLLIIDKTIHIPHTIACLFQLALHFDEKSAWWEKEYSCYDEAQDVYCIEVPKPFTKYPYINGFDKDRKRHYAGFLEGYFLAIFNGGADLLGNLASIYHTQFRKELCYKINEKSENHASKANYKLHVTVKSFAELATIDANIFRLQRSIKALTINAHASAIEALLELLQDTVALINNISGPQVEYDRGTATSILDDPARHHADFIAAFARHSLMQALYLYEIRRINMISR